jgi:hypothetical protein
MFLIKFRGGWFGPYRVREVKGTTCTLDLPETLVKTSDKINIRRLKFFEEQDAEYWVQWEGYDAAWDMWVNCDVLVDDVPHMVTAYHKLGGLPMYPRRGASKRASVGRLLLSGEVAFPPVSSCVVVAPPVCVGAPRKSAQVSVSCVLSSRK